MNPKKQRVKDRRRARKLAEEAWEAVNDGNLDLAEKIIRRAVVSQQDNPVLWNDQGMILVLRGKEADAADAFRAAISLAPTFAEPYARLAALRIKQGFVTEAITLQSHAVANAPDDATLVEQLTAYKALAGAENRPGATPSLENEVSDNCLGEWPEKLAQPDWDALGDRLTRDGCVLIERLMDAARCAQLRAMFERDEMFAKTVVMDRSDFGLGAYRYFRAPIPGVVDQLRKAIYPDVARIANGWQGLLGEPEQFPAEWVAFRDECRRAGQSTPTPILLKYGPGGFNALHRDLRGSVFFPIQMAVVLNPRADHSDELGDGFRGGEFLLCDVPERRKSRRRSIAAGLGDAVLFCTRDRLAPIGGLYGLQPVMHGVERITAGTRYVLGVPFHEYR
jgi:hypothetical protein